MTKQSRARDFVNSCITVKPPSNQYKAAILAVTGTKVISNALCGLLFMVLTPAAYAQFPVRNFSPFSQFVGVPELKSAKKLQNGEHELELNTTISNHFIVETDEADPLYLDGETTIADLVWRTAIKNHELEIAMPYVSHQEGFLDGFIIDWHKTFDFPDGDRETVDNNQLHFSYQDEQRIQQNRQVEGVGDIRINVGKQLQWRAGYQHAVHVMLKLPTGDSDKWLGSGATDLSLYSTHAWQFENWIAHAQIGTVFMEKPEVLAEKRRKAALFGNAALSYVVLQGWHLTVQLDMHSPFYHGSKQNQLGDGQAITVGSLWLGKHWSMHMAVVEDIKVDSVPDVGFQLGLKWRR